MYMQIIYTHNNMQPEQCQQQKAALNAARKMTNVNDHL